LGDLVEVSEEGRIPRAFAVERIGWKDPWARDA